MKKGFTLVELIAVFAIMSIVALIAIPGYINILKEKETKLYNVAVSEIIETAKEYMTNNPSLYNDVIDDGYFDLDIEDLCDDDYLDCPINDPRDNSSIEGYVRVTKTDNIYSYTLYRN